MLLLQLLDLPVLQRCSKPRRVGLFLVQSCGNLRKWNRTEADSKPKRRAPEPVTLGRFPNAPASNMGKRPVFPIAASAMTTKVRVSAGVCGLETSVVVRSQGSRCAIAIESNCTFVQRLAEELTDVEPLSEILPQDQLPRIWQLATKHRLHAACPVPIGILKAIEVEAGLALPADVSIAISRE